MDYITARRYSVANPAEVVLFKDRHIAPPTPRVEGALLNGQLEGLVLWYTRSSGLECQCLYKNDERHGECIYYNEDGKPANHYFAQNNDIIEELNYLVNEPRDEAFYVTLALYGIDKEYIIGAK